MSDKIFNKNIFDEFYEAFQPLWEIIDDQSGKNFGNLNPYARRSIAEAAFILREMAIQINLDDYEANFVQTWIDQFIHVLGREFEGNFILRFYYFYKNYQKDPARTVDSMISIVVALRALEICGHGPTRGGTVWGYFERDVPFFRKRLGWILEKDNEEGYCNELFLLLNMIELLYIIKNSTILKEEFEEFIKLANWLQKQFDIAFRLSPGLKIYAADMADKIGLTIEIDDIIAIPGGKPATFLALNILRKGGRPSSHIIDRAQQSSATHLSWIAKAWDRYLAGEHRIGILPFYRRLDIDAVSYMVWGNIRELYNISINREEIDKALNLSAIEIKQRLYDYFKKHSQITEYSLTRLSAERDKADAGGEISDFNVEIYAGGKNIWITLPIKSGRESGNRKRDKMEQNYFYQFIRPILSFPLDEVAVFPIILVKPTLNSNESLSQIRAHLKLPILVLDIEIFTRFLKREKLLC
jgi:hypothetical protein